MQAFQDKRTLCGGFDPGSKRLRLNMRLKLAIYVALRIRRAVLFMVRETSVLL
jgi:hypothetical protein